jgi:hypothetical protein
MVLTGSNRPTIEIFNQQIGQCFVASFAVTREMITDFSEALARGPSFTRHWQRHFLYFQLLMSLLLLCFIRHRCVEFV